MIVVKSLKRFEHPTEPDTWFDLQLPLSAGDLEAMPAVAGANTSGLKVALLIHVMRAWSYDAPINAETVAGLDVETFVWLTGAAFDDDTEPAKPARKRKASP